MPTPNSNIQVFKFGGASVKDADGVRNLAKILQLHKNKKIVVVISAMGKMTNALEKLTHAYFHKQKDIQQIFQEIKNFHFNILKELFPKKDHFVYNLTNNTFVEIDWILEDEPLEKYDYIYDQIVSIGEFVATKIVSAYLNEMGIKNQWLDVRDVIRTDNTFREGNVLWEETEKLMNEKIPILLEKQLVITQGFIGGTSENLSTTLGREGSDYSASIFAYCLNAEKIIVWKDVTGVLNADPRFFPNAKKIDHLSFHEAIEMTYYGATVIHPKTIKPIQNKNIPLEVRSFSNPTANGTLIDEKPLGDKNSPVLTIKKNQTLLSISTKDFSFITEENLSFIYSLFAKNHIKINLMQNSAISFSVCIDNNEKIHSLLNELSEHFKVLRNDDLDLITVRHYNQVILSQLLNNRKLFLEQRSRQTVQLVLK